MNTTFDQLSALKQDLKKRLPHGSDSQLLVISTSQDKSSETSLAAAEALQSMGYEGVWVALLHSTSELEKIFEKWDVDAKKLKIIDTLTRMYTRTQPVMEGVHYVDSPLSLDEILAIAKKLLNDMPPHRFIIIESMQLLSFYSGADKTISFVNKIKDLKKGGTVGVITTPSQDLINQKMIDTIKAQGDHVIEVTP